jgi:CRISPR-associated protein Cmr2
MIFDLHSWVGDELSEYAVRQFTQEERKRLKERLPDDCPHRSFNTKAAAASTGITATSVNVFEVLNPDSTDLREARRTAWRKVVRPQDHASFKQLYDACWALPDSIDPFPPCSFLIRLQIKLATALLTKDDREYYAIENAVRKDRTFGVPCLSASSWKGCFRHALGRLDPKLAEETVVRLCGHERGEEDHAKFRRGRLEFFATPFERIGFEVFNPHNRKTKKGTPIYYESVPAETPGEFCLLYVPFEGFAQERKDLIAQVAADLPVVAAALREMFLVSGFGAKVSSGFGSADEQASGKMRLRAVLPSSARPTADPPGPPLAGYLATPTSLRAEYLNPDGTFRESDVTAMNRSDKQQYGKARRWYDRQRNLPAPEEVPKVEPAKIEFAYKEVRMLKDVITVAQQWSKELEQQA